MGSFQITRHALVVAACAFLPAGCAALPFSGIAVDVGGGVTRLAGSEDDGKLGFDLGVAVSLIADYQRTSSMGIGGTHVTSWLPRAGGGHASTSQFASSFTLSSVAPALSSDDVRTRFHVGALYGNPLFAQLYAGAGVSVHPSQGTAMHVIAGPMFTLADVDGTTRGGPGGMVKLRYFRNFFARCDVKPSEARERGQEMGRSIASCR